MWLSDGNLFVLFSLFLYLFWLFYSCSVLCFDFNFCVKYLLPCKRNHTLVMYSSSDVLSSSFRLFSNANWMF